MSSKGDTISKFVAYETRCWRERLTWKMLSLQMISISSAWIFKYVVVDISFNLVKSNENMSRAIKRLSFQIKAYWSDISYCGPLIDVSVLIQSVVHTKLLYLVVARNMAELFLSSKTLTVYWTMPFHRDLSHLDRIDFQCLSCFLVSTLHFRKVVILLKSLSTKRGPKMDYFNKFRSGRGNNPL